MYAAQSSHAGELHPYVLTEPCVKVSLHTALLVYKSQFNNSMDAQTASVEISSEFPYTAALTILWPHARTTLSPTLPISVTFDLIDTKLHAYACAKTYGNN